LLPRAMQLAAAIAEQDRTMVNTMRRDWDDSMGTPIAEARAIHSRHAVEGGFAGPAATSLVENRAAVMARSRQQRDS